MLRETIVWTPLPNGYLDLAHRRVLLSVFVAPRLEASVTSPTLELFPHWHNWPQTVQAAPAGPLRFEVSFSGANPVTVEPDFSNLSPAQWSAVFSPSLTRVDSYTYTDYSEMAVTSFPAADVLSFVAGSYAAIGAAAPSLPPLLHTEQGVLSLSSPELRSDSYLAAFGSLMALGTRRGHPAVLAARAFHSYPPEAEHFKPTVTPVLDFHQAVSSFGSFPHVLVSFGLVFRLDVPLPNGLNLSSTPSTFDIEARPLWQPASDGVTTVDVVLRTRSKLSTRQFLASPRGPDYGSGMLGLQDTSRFSVIALDVDGASESLSAMSSTLASLAAWVRPGEQSGAAVAAPLPALRSVGPSIVWRGWGGTAGGTTGSLNALATGQSAVQDAVSAWVDWYTHPSPRPAEPPLPVLQAEDVIRGHRFDVYDATEPARGWRSLHQRKGKYTFGGSVTTTAEDEGTVVPGATQPATKSGPLPRLYVHESIARWAGWSLSVPRPGPSIAPDDTVDDSPANPAPTNVDDQGNQNPQLAVDFSVPPATLPKLRYGRPYRYRARAVDMGGHSLPLGDQDSANATPPVVYHRFEPVPSPVIVPTTPLGAGEGALLLVVRNYQTGSVTPNGRWLFPPMASELLVETHGMLDGYQPGQPPVPHQPPTAAAYPLLVSRVDKTVGDLPGARQATTQANGTYSYVPVPASGEPGPLSTPWLADPLATGVLFQGLPVPPFIKAKTGTQAPAVLRWRGAWPDRQAVVLLLEAGPYPDHQLVPATAGSAAMAKVSLPPAHVANLLISSTISLEALQTLGIWSWLAPAVPANERAALTVAAVEGRLWMLTPYRSVRLVHAVRRPLQAPRFRAPVVQQRAYGSVQATITDASFLVDELSTASIDVEATWTDPRDDPASPAPSTVSNTQHAFKLVVPDPSPAGPYARPMEIQPPATVFALSAGGPGALHTLGDTKHHAVRYRCTGTSRFVEFFRRSEARKFGSGPLTIDKLGLDPREVVVTDRATHPPQVLQQGVDYRVDAKSGQLTILKPKYQGKQLEVTWAPTDTATGAARLVHVLSSARPAAPKVARVAPAWALSGAKGSLGGNGIDYARTGGLLRVYLQRPWFSAGAGEVLGVVANPAGAGALARGLSFAQQAQYATIMGLDPISVSSGSESYVVSPGAFRGGVPVPKVPYRPAYSSPPRLGLVEDSQAAVDIWPFEVHYDAASQLWFADVGITVGMGDAAPPPGYFVRLALVRFQPWAFPGAEISTVTLATFAQPVAGRAISVTRGNDDRTVSVTVTGPGYYGYRPVQPGTVQYDVQNPDAEHPFSAPPFPASTPGRQTTSMMLVEVQAQDTSKGLSGELAWAVVEGTSPVALDATFSGGPIVTWSGTVPLPGPYTSGGLRLRVSEVDYPTTTPTVVDASLRRPFVALVPLL